MVVLRVIRAKLTKNFELCGRMDPFAVVLWVSADGAAEEIGHTHTDWNGHYTPQWDHTCRGHMFRMGVADSIEVQVFEDDLLSKDELCGTARSSVDDLFGNAIPRGGGPGGEGDDGEEEIWSSVRALRLVGKEGKDIGTVDVQASRYPWSPDLEIMGKTRSDGTDRSSFTRVEQTMFKDRVERVQVSGGTAPFFILEPMDMPQRNRSPSYFIGKDLARAQDEIEFYELARQVAEDDCDKSLHPLLGFMFEYVGIFTAKADDEPPNAKPKDLLVLRNLRDGAVSLRMLDLKIGNKTAQAGWGGKSKISALRTDVLDGLTNSSMEGYRLEGFDGLPQALVSFKPLLEFGGANSEIMARKALRIYFQRMSGSEILMSYLDMHSYDPENMRDLSPSFQVLTHSEYLEVVLRETAVQLAELAIACRRSPVPHKWIGSSVALAFDCGRIPARSESLEDVRKSVRVNIFDWGKSELNTLAGHQASSDVMNRERSKYWAYYVGGIDRLSWEAARAYRNRFDNAGGWREVVLVVIDFDSVASNDFLGKAQVPLKVVGSTTAPLLNSKGAEVKGLTGLRGIATVTYKIEYVSLPEDSRLRGVWRVSVVGANSLPRYDKMFLRTTSDPFVEVVAVSECGSFRFRQRSSVKPHTLDPVWRETFEIPDARCGGELERALGSRWPSLGEPLDKLMTHESCLSFEASKKEAKHSHKGRKRLEQWEERLSQAVVTLSNSQSLTNMGRASRLTKDIEVILKEMRLEAEEQQNEEEQELPSASSIEEWRLSQAAQGRSGESESLGDRANEVATNQSPACDFCDRQCCLVL